MAVDAGQPGGRITIVARRPAHDRRGSGCRRERQRRNRLGRVRSQSAQSSQDSRCRAGGGTLERLVEADARGDRVAAAVTIEVDAAAVAAALLTGRAPVPRIAGAAAVARRRLPACRPTPSRSRAPPGRPDPRPQLPLMSTTKCAGIIQRADRDQHGRRRRNRRAVQERRPP